MTTRVIPRTDPRLGRHINHDLRSRAFAYRAPSAAALVSVEHTRHIPILDQGQLGSCTGNATVGALGSGALWDGLQHLPALVRLDEAQAVSVYSAATAIDSVPGQYPPDDTGSDGLSVAKVARSRGWISGYTHTFSLADFLAALQVQPVIVGTVWYQSMFSPSSSGVLDVSSSSGVAGGHEYVARRYDAANSLIGFDNSWGTSWGAAGSFWIRVADFAHLLDQQGDATVFTPLPVAPQPPSPSSALDAVRVEARTFTARHHVGENAIMARKLRAWLDAGG